MTKQQDSARVVQEWLGLPNPIETPGHELVMATLFAAKIMRHSACKLLEAEAGLTDAQFNLLFLLRYQFANGATQTALSQRMLVNRANVTGLVDRLERDGLVERREREGDRRVKMIFLTRAGNARLDLAERPYLSAIEAITDKLDASQRAQTTLLLKGLCESISEHVDTTYGDEWRKQKGRA